MIVMIIAITVVVITMLVVATCYERRVNCFDESAIATWRLWAWLLWAWFELPGVLWWAGGQ